MTSPESEVVAVEEIVIGYMVGDYVKDWGFEDFADRVRGEIGR